MPLSARPVCLLALLAACPAGRAEAPRPVKLEGHVGRVGAVAFSPDGKRLATAGADRTARTWLVAGGRPVEVLKGHTDHVSAVAWAADGGLVTGGYDGTVRLWRPKKAPLTILTRRGAVLAVAVSPDGKTVAAGGMDGAVALLDLAGERRAELTGHRTWVNSLAFSGDGGRLVSGSSDGTVRLWDTKTNRTVKTFTLPDPREIRAAALSPDGKLVAAAVRNGAVKAWDVATGEEAASLDAHEGDAWSVCFTPDGRTLVSAGGDWGKVGKVRLWDTRRWRERTSLDHPAEALCVAVSPDGRWLAVGGASEGVRLWDLQRPKR